MFKKGDNVICVDDSFRSLTKGDIYEVTTSEYTKAGDTFIKVLDDLGNDKEFWASRFELIKEEKQMYEASDIKVGQVLLCVDNGGFPFWTTGKRYEVVADEQGKPCLYSDSGEQPLSHRTANDISVYLNSQPKNGDVVMQLIEDGKEEPTMTEKRKVYTEDDIYEGMKLKCVNDGLFSFWTTGKIYEVTKETTGRLHINNDDNSYRDIDDILGYLNGNANMKLEVYEEPRKEYTLNDIKEGMVLRCTDDKGYPFWTTDKEYTVYADERGKYIQDEHGNKSRDHQILIRLNGKGSNATMEVVSTPEPTEPEEITLTITGANYKELEAQVQKALEVLEQINFHDTVRDASIKQLDQFKGDK